MAVWAKMPAERTDASGGSNDHRTSRCHYDPTRRVVDANAQRPMMASETASTPRFGWRKTGNANDGDDERDGK